MGKKRRREEREALDAKEEIQIASSSSPAASSQQPRRSPAEKKKRKRKNKDNNKSSLHVGRSNDSVRTQVSTFPPSSTSSLSAPSPSKKRPHETKSGHNLNNKGLPSYPYATDYCDHFETPLKVRLLP